MEEKTCNVCKLSLPIDEFYARKANRGGRSPVCKSCRKTQYADRADPYEVGGEKLCFRCGKEKPVTEFCRSQRTKSGLFSHCKSCGSSRFKEWGGSTTEGRRMRYEKDKASGKAVAWTRAFREKRPEVSRQYNQRRYATTHPGTNAWRALREQVFARDSGRCQGCGADMTGKLWQMDHVIPLAANGPHVLDNLQVLCKPCNMKKWVRVPDIKTVALSGLLPV